MNLDLDEIIKALAHPVRREILHWLKDPTVEFPDQSHSCLLYTSDAADE